MSSSRKFFAAPLALALALVLVSLPAIFTVAPVAAAPVQQYGALERGYRTGYSDGYQSGWGDQSRRRAADFRGKADYRDAERGYVPAHGPVEDYRDGYRQGYEAGYGAGFNRREFDSELPRGGIARRGAADDSDADRSTRGERPEWAGGNARRDDADDAREESANVRDFNTIPSGTVLTVELLNRLSSDISQRGDRFEARVVEPNEFEGTIVAGRLSDVQRPGKTRGRAHLQLDFDQFKLPDGQWVAFRAQVVEVIAFDDSTNLEVDPEGGIRGKDSTKDDVAKVGASTGVGAIIGGIAGGGKGAGIGAIIGAGAGTAGVMTQRGKEIRFEQGQQLKIRVAGRVQ